jgi:hypothetical protein
MARQMRRKKHYTFGAEGESNAIDYKNVELLGEFVTETGKIVPSRIATVAELTILIGGISSDSKAKEEATAIACILPRIIKFAK